MRKKSVAICSSISFYQQVVDIKNQLLSLNLNPKIPQLASLMEQNQDFNVKAYQHSFYAGDPVKTRQKIVRQELIRVGESDSVLVINHTKHKLKGYIGGNVLMEMGLAFYQHKPIFVLNTPSPKLPLIDEVLAMNPHILKNNLKQISSILKKSAN